MATHDGINHMREVSRDVFSATLGSVCCCYTGQPLDTIKVRMQTNPVLYSSIGTTLSRTVSMEGISALWKGAVPTACGMAAENAVAFGVNEGLKRAFPAPETDTTTTATTTPNLTRPFIMGALTAIPVSIVLLPSEVIKAKTQVSTAHNISSQQIMKELVGGSSSPKIRPFFTGLEAQLARDISFYSVFFGGYELFCYGIQKYIPSMPDEMRYFISGGFAGMLGWTVAMPFDVPKTNVQSRYDTRVIGSYIPEMKNIYKERGFLAFYNGLGPTLVRAFPANAALFLGLEISKKFFDDLLWPKPSCKRTSNVEPTQQPIVLE